MIGSKGGVRGTERQLHRSAVNVGNKVTSGIALNDATNISDVMSKTRQNKIGVVARGRRPLQMTPDQDVMADKRDQHRVFDVVIQRMLLPMHSSASFAANGSNSVSSAWDAPNRPRVSAARNVPSVCAITSGTVISVNGDRTSR